MSRSPREYLQHMLDETTYLLQSSHGISAATFQKHAGNAIPRLIGV